VLLKATDENVIMHSLKVGQYARDVANWPAIRHSLQGHCSLAMILLTSAHLCPMSVYTHNTLGQVKSHRASTLRRCSTAADKFTCQALFGQSFLLIRSTGCAAPAHRETSVQRLHASPKSVNGSILVAMWLVAHENT